jgi:hypothetical protein
MIRVNTCEFTSFQAHYTFSILLYLAQNLSIPYHISLPMLTINYNNPNDTEWINNATYFWVIPLHPLGKMNMLDYYLVDSKPEEQHGRFIGNGHRVVYNIIITYIILCNSIVSGKIMVTRPCQLAPWCCWRSFITVTILIIIIALTELEHENFRHITWPTALNVSVAGVSNSLILLQKAYLALS